MRTAANIYYRMELDDTGFQAKLQRAGRAMRNFGATLTRIGAVAGAAIAGITMKFASFDDQMRTVQAVTGATGEQFEALTEQAKELGRTTSFTASQVAGAMTELGRAGFQTTEILASTADVLNLARATGIELARASEIAAGTMRIFGLEAKDVTRIADVLVATANSSAQTIDDLAEAMTYAGPVADEMGLSLEQTAETIGILANFSIKGSQAGAMLRRIMTQLADTKVQESMREMGVAVTDATGEFRPLADIMREFGIEAAKLTAPERLAKMKELFGQRAIAGGAKLASGSFDALTDAIANADGRAAETAAKMDAGIGGTLRRLWSAVEGVVIALGEGLAPVLESAAKFITGVLGPLTEWLKQNQWLAKSLTVVAGALIVLGPLLIGAGGLVMMFGKVIAAVKSLGVALSLLSGPAGVIALAVGAFFMLREVIDRNTTSVGELADQQQEYIATLQDARAETEAAASADMEKARRLRQLAEAGQLNNEQLSEARALLADLTGKYGDFGVSINAATGEVEAMAGAFSGLIDTMQQGLILEMESQVRDLDEQIEKVQERIDKSLSSVWGTHFGWRERRRLLDSRADLLDEQAKIRQRINQMTNMPSGAILSDGASAIERNRRASLMGDKGGRPKIVELGESLGEVKLAIDWEEIYGVPEEHRKAGKKAGEEFAGAFKESVEDSIPTGGLTWLRHYPGNKKEKSAGDMGGLLDLGRREAGAFLADAQVAAMQGISNQARNPTDLMARLGSAAEETADNTKEIAENTDPANQKQPPTLVFGGRNTNADAGNLKGY